MNELNPQAKRYGRKFAAEERECCHSAGATDSGSGGEHTKRVTSGQEKAVETSL